MEAPIYRLVYTSIPSAKMARTTPALMTDILNVSRVRNRFNGITGALMFTHGRFAQVLEGPLTAIECTFESIQNYIRQEQITLLRVEYASKRFLPSGQCLCGLIPASSDASLWMMCVANFAIPYGKRKPYVWPVSSLLLSRWRTALSASVPRLRHRGEAARCSARE